MKTSLKLTAITLILWMAVATTGCGLVQSNTNAPLQAAGLIEATETTIAPELSGKVVEVNANEGDAVKAGAVLLRLDGSLLQAQRLAAAAALAGAQSGVQLAQAGLAAAQAQYDLVLSNALAAGQPGRLADWSQAKSNDFAQPGWFYSKAERLQSTQAEVEASRTALASAQSNLDTIENKAGSPQFLEAEVKLSDARIAFQVAQAVLDQANGASDGQLLKDAAQSALNDAKTTLNNAQKAYDDALTASSTQDVLTARAKAAAAQARYNAAMDALRALQTGPDSPEVTAAAKSVDQAKPALAQAQTAVNQAQANLQLVDAQIEKLAVLAPQDGTVLTRSIQPGEILQAGAAAMTVARLDPLRVTVYIPENRYGQIKLGDAATLSVDSFPGQSFDASVTRIADQAEFTPQNVQTQQGRQTTVYAVELSIANPEGKLKPGMPADVTFKAVLP